MGRKVHPMGFRIGVIRDWQAKWFAEKHFGEFLHEDLKLRKAIQSKYTDSGISSVDIERQANKVAVTIYTARPGIVIGRGGQRVDEMRLFLESLIGKRVQLNIREIQQPELDAYLVARTIADQIERRIAYRRAMKQAMFRTIQAGAKGIKVRCGGRLGGGDIARRQTMHEGRVPLQTLRADVDYGFAEAHTALSLIGVKVWIYKGDILPELEVAEAEGMLTGSVMPVEAEEAPSEPVAEAAAKPRRRRAEPVTAPEAEEAPSEPVAEAAAKPRRRRAEPVTAPEVEEAPSEPVAEAAAKPRRRRAAPVTVPEAGETPSEPVAEAATKPRRRRAEPVTVPEAEEAPSDTKKVAEAKPKRKRAGSAQSAAAELEEEKEEDATA